MSSPDVAARVRAVLAAHPVIDGHNDLAWELRERAGYRLDVLNLARDQREVGLQTDLPRLRAGGVGAQFWSVWTPGHHGGNPVATTLEQIDAVYAMVRRYPDQLALAASADAVDRAVADGRIAALIGIEGGHQIAASLGTLRMMYELGARYLTLTHNESTAWADAATDAPRAGGLSAFGREVVRECNRLGMLVDLSHTADSTMHAALDTSEAPAFFSHSSARAICDHPRNVPDGVLDRVRDSGGIVMVTFVPGFLNEECHAWMDAMSAEEDRLAAAAGAGGQATATTADPGVITAQRAGIEAWLTRNPRPPCDVTDVADHVAHVRSVAGVDGVGLGGDFDGIVRTPDGLPDVSGYPNLLAELATRGWSDTDLGKLCYGNAIRVLRATESVARRLRAERPPSLATITELDG
jgi:membrane dipeptidase